MDLPLKAYNPTAGLVLLGAIDDQLKQAVINQAKNKAQALGNSQTITCQPGWLENQAQIDKDLAVNQPMEKRAYSLFHINQAQIKKLNPTEVQGLIRLIDQQRPLKIVFIFEIDSLLELPPQLKEAMIGNMGTYVIGAIELEDEQEIKAAQIITDKSKVEADSLIFSILNEERVRLESKVKF